MDEFITYITEARKRGISEFRLVDHGQASEFVTRLYIHPLGRDGVSADIELVCSSDDEELLFAPSGDWSSYAVPA
jgi:hypothetical protein